MNVFIADALARKPDLTRFCKVDINDRNRNEAVFVAKYKWNKAEEEKSGSRAFVRVSDGLFLAFGQKYDRADGKSLEKIKRAIPPTITTSNDTHELLGDVPLKHLKILEDKKETRRRARCPPCA